MPSTPHFPGRIRAYLLVYLTGALGFGALFVVPPVVNLIRDDLGLTYTQAGLLLAVPFFTLIATPVFGGWLGDRIGIFKIIALASIILSVGAFLRGLAPSFLWLVLFSVLCGVGLGMTWPNSPRVIHRWFPAARVATLLGLSNTGFIVVAAVTQSITLPVLLPLGGGWRGAFTVWGGIVGIATALWLIGYPRKEPPLANVGLPAASAPGDPLPSLLTLLKDRRLWLIAILYLVLDIQYYGVTGWMPTYLQEAGVMAESSGLMTAAFFWAAVPFAALLPMWSDRVGLRRPFIWVPAFINLAAALLFLAWPAESSWVLLAMMGAALVGPFMIVLALAMQLFHPSVTGTALGVITSIGYSGAVIGPSLMGYLREVGGNFYWSWMLIIAAAMGYAVLPFFLPETGHGVRARHA